MQRSDDHRLAVEYLAKARRELACRDLDSVESSVRSAIDVLEKEAPSEALRGAYVLLGMIIQLGGDLDGSDALFAKSRETELVPCGAITEEARRLSRVGLDWAAEELFERALDWIAHEYGETSTELVRPLLGLGDHFFNLEETTERDRALICYKRAREILSHNLGEDHVAEIAHITLRLGGKDPDLVVPF